MSNARIERCRDRPRVHRSAESIKGVLVGRRLSFRHECSPIKSVERHPRTSLRGAIAENAAKPEMMMGRLVMFRLPPTKT